MSPAQAAAGAPGRRWVIAVWVVAREAGSKPHASSGTVAPEAGGELRAGRGRSRGNETRGLGVEIFECCKCMVDSGCGGRDSYYHRLLWVDLTEAFFFMLHLHEFDGATILF